MDKKFVDKLKSLYPDAKSELNFKTPFELLVAVVLAAQCTDKRVNAVTEKLFKVASTPAQFAHMSIGEIEEHIKSINFFHNKAKAIFEASNAIVKKFGGVVPKTVEELVSLPGVGIKSASVILAAGFNIPALPVDTHVFRVSNRLGIAQAKTPEEMHEKLKKIVPVDFWIDFHHSIVLHGRYVCKAAKPDCANCELKQFCKFFVENK